MPSWPQTTGSPALTSRSLRHAARPSVDDDDRVHALLLDLDPLPAQPHVRAVVGRRIEVVGDAAVLLGRLDERVALAHRMAAERRELLQQVVERLRVSAAVMRISMRDGSSLVRPMSNVRISYEALNSMILSKIAESRPESIRWPCGLDRVAGSHGRSF